MSMYKCIPAVKKKCGIDCEGTYNGTDCECAKINMAYLPPTVRDELASYRATGFSPEEIADITARCNILDGHNKQLREIRDDYWQLITVLKSDNERYREAEQDGRILPISPDGEYDGEKIKAVAKASNGNIIIETWAQDHISGTFMRHVLTSGDVEAGGKGKERQG